MLLRDEVYITQLDIYVRNTTKHAINIPNLYKVMYRIRLFVTEYFVVFQFAKRFPMGNYIIVRIKRLVGPSFYFKIRYMVTVKTSNYQSFYILKFMPFNYYDDFIEWIFSGMLRDM